MLYGIHFSGWSKLLARQRTPARDTQLGVVLTFVAGAINAGGFLAVGQYTSHMTGILSHGADELALGNLTPVLVGFLAFVFFVLGSMFAAWSIHWGLRRNLRGAFGIPFVFEAGSLLVFGIFGTILDHVGNLLVPLTVLQLCYLMGLQNAAFGQISLNNARSTHLTGMVTDLGVELGKMTYYNSQENGERVQANRHKLRTQSVWILSFFAGGVLGAIGFKHLGYITTAPFACVLLALAAPGLWQDWRAYQAQRAAS